MSEKIQISLIGEHLVMINLIEQGWSIAKPLPDIGIDLIAIKIEDDKESKVRCIQVKTSERYNQVKNICRKKSHNLYGFKFEKVIQG